MCRFCKEAKKNKLFNFCPICGERIRDFTLSFIKNITYTETIDVNGKVVDRSLPTTTLIPIDNKY